MTPSDRDRALRERHNEFFTGEHARNNRGRVLTPGQQKLVSLLRMGALGENLREGRGRPALDAGCGAGFNTVSLGLLGWRAHAFDITPELAENARANAAGYGVEAEVRCGTNQAVPFADASMDLLVSMNAVHYVESAGEIEQAFAEFARVLRPGGRLYLTTNHPENWIFQDGEPAGKNLVRVRRDGDYRDGLTLYRFRNEAELRSLAEAHFSDVRIGTDMQEYFVKTLRNYVLTGVRA
ncbi:class I SAM-dependent methyltransferase [Paucidesulfovibrio longus]|uniref:class I SAM-dependent methyltransferase n=1 Tax=Paucidesulfovibrio longus TaxID=889 RepID=UPI0003B76340|nr:class I SAM-dependent methyltransferase [Paucidesulfovibrio longus]